MPDADYRYVAVLINGDGSDGSTSITDRSPSPKAITAQGNAKISTAQNKFGGSSVYFDGTGDALVSPNHVDFNFGTEPFTIEMWLYANSLTNLPMLFTRVDSAATADAGWFVEVGASNLYFGWGVTAGNFKAFSVSISTGVWTHIAVTRVGTAINCFVDGVSAGAATYAKAALSYDKTTQVYLGGDNTTFPTLGLSGYLDDIRITKGLARYTSNFTPPAAAFPDYAAQVSGTVEDSTGTPASRTVRAYRRDTGAFLKEGVSTSGSYTLNLTYAGEVNVICLDDVAGTTENDLILRTTAS